MKFTQILTISCLATMLAGTVVNSAYARITDAEPASSSSSTSAALRTISLKVNTATWSLPAAPFAGTRALYSRKNPAELLFSLPPEATVVPAFTSFVNLIGAANSSAMLRPATQVIEFGTGDRALAVDLPKIGFVPIDGSYTLSVPANRVSSLVSYMSSLTGTSISALDGLGATYAWAAYDRTTEDVSFADFNKIWATEPGTDLSLSFRLVPSDSDSDFDEAEVMKL